MQLRVIVPTANMDSTGPNDMGDYVADVTDVLAAKRYIRKFEPEGKRFLVVQVKADLKPVATVKTLFKF